MILLFFAPVFCFCFINFNYLSLRYIYTTNKLYHTTGLMSNSFHTVSHKIQCIFLPVLKSAKTSPDTISPSAPAP